MKKGSENKLKKETEEQFFKRIYHKQLIKSQNNIKKFILGTQQLLEDINKKGSRLGER